MTQPDPPIYVDLDRLDPCELPDLLIRDHVSGKVRVPVPGGVWTCEHGITWTAVPVGVRGGVPQMAWIIRPPGEAPAVPTAPATS